MRRNILLLSAGRRVELLECFRESAKRLLPDAEILASDFKPDISAACAVADRAFASPRADDAAFPGFLRDLCAREGIGLVVPTIDTELAVLAGLRDAFAQAGTHLAISDQALVAACRDKRRTAEVFRAAGIDTPEVYARGALCFPCFAKPYDGSSSIGARRVQAAEELSADDLCDPKLMFMELVEGDGIREYTVDAYFDRVGRLQSMVPRLRIETRAGEVSKGVTRRARLAEWLRPHLSRLEGARGCITLQLFADEERDFYRAIEINPRFGGGYPLSYAAGADFPGWLIEEYLLDRSPAFSDDWRQDLLMLRYDAKIVIDAAGRPF